MIKSSKLIGLRRSLAMLILGINALGDHLAAAEPRIRLQQDKDAFLVQTMGTEGWTTLARYNMASGSRPYLHPVKDPSGKITLTDDKPADHPWQHGIFTGFHGVNGFNYWKEDQGRQRFVRLARTEPAGGDSVFWISLIELVDPDGKVVLEEENAITFHAPAGSEYVIDFDLKLRARETDVTFKKFYVGGLSVRMPWDEKNPRHTHLNSEGLIGRAGEQKRARWCTVERPFNGKTFGFAILDHPKNHNHPSGWRVDEQGLINPNVSMLGDWNLPARQEKLFRYRIIVFEGAATSDKMEARWRRFLDQRLAE